jgi:glycosyltransferase 2 family protein
MRAMRWRSLFAHDRRPGRRPVLAATMIGYLFNNILPARAGEAARVVALTQRTGTPAAEIVGTVVVERAYDVLSVLIIFFCASPWLPHQSWFGTAAILAGVAAVALGAIIVALALHGDRPLRWLVRPLGRLPGLSAERVEREAATLAGGLAGLREHRVAFEALVWSLAAWMTSALWAWFVLLAFEPSRGFGAGVLVTVVIGLSMIIPSPPAAVGVFEAAGVLALHAYHVSQSAALPYALVLHVSNFVPLVLVGAITLHFAARRPSRPGSRATYT